MIMHYQNIRLAEMFTPALETLDRLDHYGISVLEIRLGGSMPLIIIEDPGGKLTDATPVTRTSRDGDRLRTVVNTCAFAGARLQWLSR